MIDTTLGIKLSNPVVNGKTSYKYIQATGHLESSIVEIKIEDESISLPYKDFCDLLKVLNEIEERLSVDKMTEAL